jgi:DNA-directed RNA polymerase subunit RPC12/RpoP
VHSEERPFACNICPWRFISKGRLKDHLKVHARKAV